MFVYITTTTTCWSVLDLRRPKTHSFINYSIWKRSKQ